jgi:hypothetical protein
LHPERPDEEWYWDGAAWTESRWAEAPACCLRIRRTRNRGKFSLARFRVCFDGEWQGEFDAMDDAMEWAREVSETGRMTWVVERSLLPLRWRFKAAFPEDREPDARKLWQAAVFASRVGGGSL